MTYRLLIERGGDHYEYTISNKDKLDLTRAVAKEGKQPEAVTWALLQRFAWLYPTFSTLSDLVKAYAQPINPRWFPNGDKHIGYLAYLKKINANTDAIRRNEQLAKNRVLNSTATYDDISPKYIRLVDDVLGGKIKNSIPGGVHYIASQVSPNTSEATAKATQQSFIAGRPDLKSALIIDSLTSGNNWFFDVEGSKNMNLTLMRIDNQNENTAAAIYLLFGVATSQLTKYLE
jgi:hypothetical protein